MDEFNYEEVYKTARKFAKEYSQDIIVVDTTKESAVLNGICYPCVPLKFIAKGNKDLYDTLLSSGYCSKMDGNIENGHRIRIVLLWIEPNCKEPHKILEGEI